MVVNFIDLFERLEKKIYKKFKSFEEYLMGITDPERHYNLKVCQDLYTYIKHHFKENPFMIISRQIFDTLQVELSLV